MERVKQKFVMANLFRNQMFIPIAALLIIFLFNLIADPTFFKITLGYNNAGNPLLNGYLITILDYGSELAILAIGMTLVTATGYFRRCCDSHSRFRDLEGPVRIKLQIRRTPGTDHCSFPGSMRGSRFIRRIQRCTRCGI